MYFASDSKAAAAAAISRKAGYVGDFAGTLAVGAVAVNDKKKARRGVTLNSDYVRSLGDNRLVMDEYRLPAEDDNSKEDVKSWGSAQIFPVAAHRAEAASRYRNIAPILRDMRLTGAPTEGQLDSIAEGIALATIYAREAYLVADSAKLSDPMMAAYPTEAITSDPALASDLASLHGMLESGPIRERLLAKYDPATGGYNANGFLGATAEEALQNTKNALYRTLGVNTASAVALSPEIRLASAELAKLADSVGEMKIATESQVKAKPKKPAEKSKSADALAASVLDMLTAESE